MKILILGANGMMGSMMSFVGSKVKKTLIVPLSRKDFDAITSSIDMLNKWCFETEKIYIINCIGAIPQREYSENDMIYLNAEFPKRLAAYCKIRQIPLIHLSTNCVFSGKSELCSEVDLPDAEDVYGKSKAEGEPNYGLILRSSIIGFEPNSRFGLLEWFLRNESSEVQGYTDHIWNGITTLELTNYIFDCIETENIPEYEIRHIYSVKCVSKYELLQNANEIFSKYKYILPVSKGPKQYTLTSQKIHPRKSIYNQLVDLKNMESAYKEFYRIKD